MTGKQVYALKAREDFPNWRFDTLEIGYERDTKSVWMNYKADAPHSFTPLMLAEMTCFRDSLAALFENGLTEDYAIRYLVVCSRKIGIHGLGGDLQTFASAVRRRNFEGLLVYATACIELIFSLTQGLNLPIVTIAAVHGQCLGGAFEAVLACDIILVESSARLGVPEANFNTFPGMGAITLLTRRVGPARALRIISDGSLRSGAEMHDIEIVDGVAPDGEIRDFTRAFMLDAGQVQWQRRRAVIEARRRLFPVTREELMRITEVWADCTTRITERDIRHMERLARAQIKLPAPEIIASENERNSPLTHAPHTTFKRDEI